ncbi:MAG: Rpn family recombination-promoting nuclease/putative transposase [Gammaproteobacteria bacterium]
MKRTIPTPHDHFFRAAMSRQEVAKAFFETHLPAHILKRVDLKTLTLRKESFIDEELKEAISDLLFSVNFNQHLGYLYLLVEHRSIPWRWLPLKVLQYLISALENHRKETRSQHLPIIVPLVFYHGEKTPYTEPTELLNLFDDPAGIMKDIVSSRFHLVDIGQMPDEALKEKAWLNVLQFCSKHAFARDLLAYMPQIITLWQELTAKGEEDYILESLNYLLNAGKISDKRRFIKMIQEGLPSKIGDRIMNIAQQFREEGREEGREQGREQGRIEGLIEAQKNIARRSLKSRLDIKVVAQLTGLSIEAVQAIANELKQEQH